VRQVNVPTSLSLLQKLYTHYNHRKMIIPGKPMNNEYATLIVQYLILYGCYVSPDAS